MEWARQQTGRSSGLGLTAIVEAFRRDRRLRDAGDKPRSKAAPSTKKKGGNTDWSSLSSRVTTEVLQEMNFPLDHIREALQVCGPRAQACIEYCLVLAQDGDRKPVSDSAASLRD